MIWPDRGSSVWKICGVKIFLMEVGAEMDSAKNMLEEYDKIIETIKHRWLDGIFFEMPKLEAVMHMLSDDESRDLYCREILLVILDCFMKGDLSSKYAGLMDNATYSQHVQKARELPVFKTLAYPEGCTVLAECIAATWVLEQYRYQDKVAINEGDVCVDCGACLGDTSMWMLECGASQCHLFEIDQRNIGAINKNLSKFNDRTFVNQMALSDKLGKAYYKPLNGNIAAGRITTTPPRRK